jgi:hypothetical protein
MMQNQGWFAAKKGIECLHIKFTLAKDVFESRTTQKQGENAEYMFESRTTQMQERENDEDITNMDTPTLVAYVIQKYLHGSCKERMDYETPRLGTKYKCSQCFHQV